MRLRALSPANVSLLIILFLTIAGPAQAVAAPVPSAAEPAMSVASPAAAPATAETALAALFPKPAFRSSTYLCEVPDPCGPGVLCSIQCNEGQHCFCLHALGQTQDGCYIVWVRPARCF